MNQQRRLFTAIATSDVKVGQQQMSSRTLHEHRFRVGPRIAIALAALLFCSCSTLTPDRIAVLAALAGNAAQIGVQAWLKEHPEHRDSFEAVARAIAAFLAAQGGPPDARESTVALVLTNLPPGVQLKSKESELYISGTRKGVEPEVLHLVIYDVNRGKSYRVDGNAVILKAVRNGLLRALEPMPPLPSAPPAAVRVRTFRAAPDGYDSVRPQDVGRYFKMHPNAGFVRTNSPYTLELNPGVPTNNYGIRNIGLAPVPAQPPPVVESPTSIVPAGKYAPRGVGIYRVERLDGTNGWVEVQSFTSKPMEFRVKRVR